MSFVAFVLFKILIETVRTFRAKARRITPDPLCAACFHAHVQYAANARRAISCTYGAMRPMKLDVLYCTDYRRGARLFLLWLEWTSIANLSPVVKMSGTSARMMRVWNPAEASASWFNQNIRLYRHRQIPRGKLTTVIPADDKTQKVNIKEATMARLNMINLNFGSRTHERAPARHISPELQLRRSVLACLLWETQFYEDGVEIAGRITELVPKVEAEKVAALAVEARERMKLRHAPLLLVREMARFRRSFDEADAGCQP